MRARFPEDFTRSAGVWVSERTRPTDYSDGVRVEGYLERVIRAARDLGTLSPELHRAIRDWPSHYHLSAVRSNLLRGFRFAPGSRVLEIGSGCGALTRFLGEAACRVTAVEGARQRAGITQARCRDLPEVEVVCGNFGEIRFPSAFDVVTLIGVLEYAARYGEHGDERDFRDLLGRARSFLRPGGVLVLAIENQLGLKYLAGCREDHSDRLFEGVEGYHHPAAVRTFGKEELRALLRAAGFPACEFYYPFPDYKLPSVILADRELGPEGGGDLNLAAWCDLPVESYGRPRLHLFSEALALRELEKNGLLEAFSNSFLVFAHAESPPNREAPVRLAHGWAARKFNLDRPPEHRTVVTLRLDSGSPRVHRAPLHGGGAETVEAYFAGAEKLSLLLLRAARGTRREQERFFALYRKYLAFLREQADERDTLPGNAVDLLPGNIMVDASGALHGFDYEWDGGDRVPVRRVLFRSCRNLYDRERRWLARLPGRPPSAGAFARLVFRRLGLSLSRREARRRLREENRFQAERILPAYRAAPVPRPLRRKLAGGLLEHVTHPFELPAGCLRYARQLLCTFLEERRTRPGRERPGP